MQNMLRLLKQAAETAKMEREGKAYEERKLKILVVGRRKYPTNMHVRKHVQQTNAPL